MLSEEAGRIKEVASLHHTNSETRNPDRKIAVLAIMISVCICSGILLIALWYSNIVVLPGLTPYTMPNQQLQSTAQYLSDHPEPFPESPRFVVTSPPPGNVIHFFDEACVYLSVSTFWERGEDPSDVVNNLLRSTVITVDAVPIQASAMTLGNLVEDPQKGLAPGPIEFCFRVTLRSGAHLFQLITKYPDNETYSYSWSWVVNGD